MSISNIIVTKSIIPSINKTNPPEIITYNLKKASCGLANLLRVFIDYVPVKYLYCDHADIKTDQYIILDEIIGRISQIPILQDIPINTQVTLQHKNNDNSSPVYSKYIKTIKGQNVCINDFFRLLILDKNKYIKINMTVKTTSIKFKNVNASSSYAISPDKDNKYQGITLLQKMMRYEILDYIRIFIFKNDELKECYVKYNNIASSKVNSKTLYYVDKKYDTVIDSFKRNNKNPNSSEINKLDEYFDEIIYNKDLEIFTVEQIFPTEFLLSYKTYGNIPVKQLFKNAFDNLIEIYKNIIIYKENDGYKIITYEHVAAYIFDRLKILYEDINVVMQVRNVGYNTILFYLEAENGEELIKKTIQYIINLLLELKMNF